MQALKSSTNSTSAKDLYNSNKEVLQKTAGPTRRYSFDHFYRSVGQACVHFCETNCSLGAAEPLTFQTLYMVITLD